MRICTLDEAYDIILSKLADVTPEKRLRYQLVYAKLHDFECFLRSHGVRDDGSVQPYRIVTPLFSRRDALDALRELTFENNIRLMNAVSTDASFDHCSSRRAAKRTPCASAPTSRCFDEYNTYMSGGNKQQAARLLLRAADVPGGRRPPSCGAYYGQVLANSGPKYRKMLPSAAPRTASADDDRSAGRIRRAVGSNVAQCLHPDHKIAPKHALRISNSLKAICGTLFRCASQRSQRGLRSRCSAPFAGLPETECFVLLDALYHVRAAAVESS